jgi:Tol biopolymer transport system component
VDAVLDAPAIQRADRIAELCGGDAARAAELERIVVDCERAYPLLDACAVESFAAVLAPDPPAMPGTLADRYRVVCEVGRGGMAVVYLARDLKHDRDVAVKVVRPELAAAIARVRFLREIEIAARLRHPHIVPLYDSGELPADPDPGEPDASLLYYVMPYEAGRSLRERLDSGTAHSVDEAVRILREVGEALAHAHQHGIVHRDIKPDNVLLSGGHALVTDFGVARAVTEAATGAAAGSGSTALGTPTYMAPEQVAPGARVDHRADLYSLGVLGFELLAGHPPFAGDGPPSPRKRAGAMRDLRRARPNLPPALVGALARCLAERPGDRWQSAGEFLAALEAISEPATVPAGARQRTGSRAALLGAGVGALTLAVTFGLSITAIRDRGEPTPLRLGRAGQLTSEPGLEVQPSLSPDGRAVAYAVGNSLHMRIAVRPTAGGRARWLTTDSAAIESLPFWSPDGRRVLFLSRGGVFSAPARGGAARQEVAGRAGAIVRSATPSRDGRAIAFVRADSLLLQDLRSGATRLITTGADLHSCRWSPDGAWLACVSGNSFYMAVQAVPGVGPMFANRAPSSMVLVRAAGGRPIGVSDSASLNQSPVWSPDGRRLYYVSDRDGPRDLYALDFRPRAPQSGAPVRITTGMGVHSFDLSADGARLVYAAYSNLANAWAIPIPREPRAAPVSATAETARPVTVENQSVEGVRVSSDGRWLVYDSDRSGSSHVYRIPTAGGEAELLTHGEKGEFRGALSPSGRELAYHSFRTGSRQIFLLTLTTGSVRQLTRFPGQLAMANWAPGGSAVSFFDMTTDVVMVVSRDPNGQWGTPRVLATRGWRPEWSPDGRTLAFISPFDGRISIVPAVGGTRRDVYVPATGDPRAELAVFSADGRRLYFKSHDALGRASFWSVPVSGGRPRPLVRFDDPAWSSNRFDFASDGSRFYFTVEDRQSDLWLADVARR